LKGQTTKKKIEALLEAEVKRDPVAHRVVVSLLREVYNEGAVKPSDRLQKRLYDLIDHEARHKEPSDGD
jgi:hypothetical protein